MNSQLQFLLYEMRVAVLQIQVNAFNEAQHTLIAAIDKVDPVSASRLGPITRAIEEVAKSTGEDHQADAGRAGGSS